MNIDNILDILKPDINVFDGRGRGRKECPECRRYIGVRHKVCICKHEFKKKEQPVTEVEGPEYIEARDFMSALGYNHIGFRILFIPRGECPVKFTGSVSEWADAVIERYYGYFYLMSPMALRYMLDKFSPVLSDRYKENRKALYKWISQVKLGEHHE